MILTYPFYFQANPHRREARLPLRVVPDDLRPPDGLAPAHPEAAHEREARSLQDVRKELPGQIHAKGESST